MATTILGIDMSRAFDTIRRDKLMEILKTILDNDSIRMVRALLIDTELTVKIGPVQSRSFKTSIGTPQGDSISPVLFIVYLEAALRDLRKLVKTTSITEVIYADDVDFLSHDKSTLEELLNIAPHALEKWFLKVNIEKTEYVTINREANRTDEKWRNSKKVGTLLGDSEDIMRRKMLSTVALNKLRTTWLRNREVGTALRAKLYNAFIKPILLYNGGTWGISESESKSLDAFHRRQLRILIGINWPKKIKNSTLYNICNSRPVSVDITEARWRLLGHILRLDQDVYANWAMESYYAKDERSASRGRPRNTLPIVISKELQRVKRQLKNGDDLDTLRSIAYNRTSWKIMTEKIVSYVAHVGT
ncbi:uncharacterized protein LOC115230848 [Octopus sinensis]|uniref:Uncharacterized protein LOC115227926 n=1 Tax=Octopus sinensis TaxID=2607531 RepID=A0A6P7U3H6_9MOLL|nr:uncharacterized protein LOC115227926 [Octopus sinensis]XP_029656825.1 uncharacterized protein LOC115230840 [Octopus sinensis]XP_029656833.1 uncharacterized protein LOC115230848 [Octopus sinensis]